MMKRNERDKVITKGIEKDKEKQRVNERNRGNQKKKKRGERYSLTMLL